jgi:hypothetical protein
MVWERLRHVRRARSACGRRGPGQLLAQGMKLLSQSPELTRLTDELGGRLLEAGKGAAVAIATRQVENLTERVVGRVGALTDAGGRPRVMPLARWATSVARSVRRSVVSGRPWAGPSAVTRGRRGRRGRGGRGGRRGRREARRGGARRGGGWRRAHRLDEAGGDGEGGAPETDEDDGPPSRRPASTGAGGNGAGNAAPKRAGGPARLAGKAAAAPRRSARPRTAGAQ